MGHSYALPTTQLSPREIEIIRLLAHGQQVDDIANELCLARQTVKNYIWRAGEKAIAAGWMRNTGNRHNTTAGLVGYYVSRGGQL